MSYLNLLAEASDGWFYAYVESSESPKLDRSGVSIAFANMLKADTSVLYGASNLVQIIDPNPVRYSNAKIDAKTNNTALYVWAEPDDTTEVRMRNSDKIYNINMRFETMNINYNAGVKEIDDAYEQVHLLTNEQMYQGQMMTDYYTDGNAQIIDIEPVFGSLPPPEQSESRRNVLTTEIEGVIKVAINRWA